MRHLDWSEEELLTVKKMVESFLKELWVKESPHLFGMVLSWSQIKKDQNEDLSSSPPAQQALTVSQDPRLTSCLRVTQVYKTVLNLQRFWDASRMMKTRHFLGSRAEHIIWSSGSQSKVLTASLQTSVKTWLRDPLKQFSSTGRVFCQSPALNRLTWLQVLWTHQVELLYLRSRGWGVLS